MKSRVLFCFVAFAMVGCGGGIDSMQVKFKLKNSDSGLLLSSIGDRLSTQILDNRYSLTPDNYTIYIAGIYLVRCENSSGDLEDCRTEAAGDSQTVTRTAIYESSGIPVSLSGSGTSFAESLNLDDVSDSYNGVQLKVGYIQQRFPMSNDVVGNLRARAYRICTSPASEDLCDIDPSSSAERGDYLLEQSGTRSDYKYLYFTGCSGSSADQSTSCEGFDFLTNRPADYGIYDQNFTDMLIGSTNEWIDGFWSPIIGISEIDSDDIEEQDLEITFDITDSFHFHDNAMSISSCSSASTGYNCTFSGFDPMTSETDAGNLNASQYDILDDNAFLPQPPGLSVSVTSPTSSSSSSSGVAERLYVGTGEYDSADDWDAVLRFEDASATDSRSTGAIDSSGTIDVKSSFDSNGVRLNFVHTIYVDESRNEMYLGSLFTTGDNHNCSGTEEVCGSIAVISNASSADGGQTVSRHLFGDATEINQPHGVWVDTSRNILYAANTMSENILVWDSASTVDGNEPYDRKITNTSNCTPVFVFVDENNDRLFVACMGSPAIWIYLNASSVTGTATPDIVIAGSATRLNEGNNLTTHNVWFDSSQSLLFIGHHTNEVLIYDLSTLSWSTTAASQNLVPRVLKINEDSAGSDEYLWSCYGLFYLPSLDRLYVSAGYTPTATSLGSFGPPAAGTPENAVKIYDGVSDSSMSGVVTPDQEIYWSSGSHYYPPQALWVTLH